MSRAVFAPFIKRSIVGFLPLSALLAACGADEQEVPDEIEPAEVYASRCEFPRTAPDPLTNQRYDDVRGTQLDEKLWLRSWIDDTYLWYREVPRADPRAFPSALEYFKILKTGVNTASGAPKDKFHFTYPTSEWVALSQSGVEAGYGAQWVLLSSFPPRKLIVAYSEPGSPAAAMGIERGTEVRTVDGVDLEGSNNVDALNGGLFPAVAGERHTFGIIDRGGAQRTVTMVSANIENHPVQHVGTLPAPNDKVGYILFNDHIATAEQGLVDAIAQLRTAAVTDLVLDMRYNGGGYLAIAAQLAYMIAGPEATDGKVFERIAFNDKYPTTDPITGFPLQGTRFIPTTLGFSATPDQPLPTLGLRRVFVLTSGGTCSASEAVMNGLAGADIEVIQIGTKTCGKPYGFYPAENCGTTYFAIQFQGVNQKGFGDYTDGFVPGANFKGCTAADDFTHGLGDPAEGRLAAALAYRANQTCTVARTGDPLAAADGEVLKSVWRQNRIMTMPGQGAAR